MAKRKTGIDDYGYKKTDEQLEELETRLSSLYTDASRNMQDNLGEFLKQYEDADAQKRAELKAGKITEKEYKAWRQEQILNTKKMQAQIDSLTEDLVNTDKLAMQMINGQLPSVYATNYNFEGYKAETLAQAGGIDYSSFTIYNADAVSRIVKENPDLLPHPSVDIPEDEKWNKQHINLAIAQGILQGDPVDKIADRLQTVAQMDNNAAIRNARTALIGAQNAGRKDAADRVREAGIQMVDVWSSTYDGRTRDTHIALDGQERQADGYFHTFNGDKLEYPCDPNGAPAEVYNCRCRLNSYIKGIDHSKDKELYEDFMEKGGYEGWEKTKEKAEKKAEGFEKNKATLPQQKTQTAEKEPPTPKEALDDYLAQGKDWSEKITTEEKKAVSDYGYNRLSAETNGYLREEKDKYKKEQVKEIKEQIKRLDSAIEKGTIDKDTTLYRGVGRDYLGIDFSDPSSLIGETIKEGGYMSTTGNLETAEIYGRGVVMEIDVPKGTNAAFVDLAQEDAETLRQWFKEDGDAGNTEYLLERGGDLIFTGYTYEKDSDGKEYLKLFCEFKPDEKKKGG